MKLHLHEQNTFASSAIFFSSSTSSVFAESSLWSFLLFCLGAMKPWRNFFMTLACRAITHSPKSFSFSNAITYRKWWKHQNECKGKMQGDYPQVVKIHLDPKWVTQHEFTSVPQFRGWFIHLKAAHYFHFPSNGTHGMLKLALLSKRGKLSNWVPTMYKLQSQGKEKLRRKINIYWPTGLQTISR